MHSFAKYMMHFPKLTKTNFIGILYNLVYVFFFLGVAGNDGEMALDGSRELKGLTWGVHVGREGWGQYW